MNLSFEAKLADSYKSQSQKARILTEHWVDTEIFCPNCGQPEIEKYKNGKPVADFFCANCQEDYELKSKQDTFGTKIVDGAYRTMIERLQSSSNPNFFLLRYDLQSLAVRDFCVIPKHFFVPGIIEKRKPLATTAERARWVGCNILLQSIPKSGRIFFVKNKVLVSKGAVLSEWKRTLFLREEKEIVAKGWLLDVMRCIERLSKREFMLDDVYAFEQELGVLHPENKHVKDKIRQQLQVLRDKGYLEFVSRGIYRLG